MGRRRRGLRRCARGAGSGPGGDRAAAGRRRRRPLRLERPAAAGPRARRAPAAGGARPGDWRVPEYPATGRRPRPPRQDWRAPEYPTGSGRARYEPADGYEASEEWEEWLEPGAPHGQETIGPLPERHKGPRRRRLSAGAVLLAMLLGFFLAGLLDARNIRKDVEARPYGALRSLQLALLAPMTGLSGLVRADDLGAAVASALGRGEEPHHTLAEVKKTRKSLWPRTITEKKPLRLYVAGDSMDQVFGSSLVNLGEETGLRQGQERLPRLQRPQPPGLLRLAAASGGPDRGLPARRGRRPLRRQRRPGRPLRGQGPQGGHQGLAGGLRPARRRGDGHPRPRAAAACTGWAIPSCGTSATGSASR